MRAERREWTRHPLCKINTSKIEKLGGLPMVIARIIGWSATSAGGGKYYTE